MHNGTSKSFSRKIFSRQCWQHCGKYVLKFYCHNLLQKISWNRILVAVDWFDEKILRDSFRFLHCVPQCVEITGILWRIFGKNFVKLTVLLNKLLKSWFHEIFFRWERIPDSRNFHTVLLLTLWKIPWNQFISQIIKHTRSNFNFTKFSSYESELLLFMLSRLWYFRTVWNKYWNTFH